MLRFVTRKGISVFVLILMLASSPVAGKDPQMPPLIGVEDARQRLVFLREQAEQVEPWVEKNWQVEFDRSNPGLSRKAQQVPSETPEAFKERQMKVRMATSDVKARMRSERKEWLAAERERIPGTVFSEFLPVKLGPYDNERKLFPLLLGFGWPSGLSVTLHIPDRERKLFEIKFPPKLPATFRVNELGEVTLLSVERRWDTDVQELYVTPPGPRLAWQATHDSWITAVAFRPDGSQVISAGADSVIASRDAESGNPLFRLEKAEMAMSMAYAPNGSTFATGGADSTLRIRSSVDGKEIWNVRGKGMIMSVAYSPDGRHVATGDDAGYLKVFNAETGEEKFKVPAEMPVRSIDFTRGGKGIVVGGEGQRVLLWNLGSDRIVWRKTTEWPVYAVASSPAGGLVAVGGSGNRLLVLSETDGTESWSATTEGEVRSLRFDPAGRLLASGGAGYTAKVFSAVGGQAIWSATIGSPIRALAFGADGRKLFVGSADAGLRMFNIDEADRVQAAFGTPGRIYVDRNQVERLFR